MFESVIDRFRGVFLLFRLMRGIGFADARYFIIFCSCSLFKVVGIKESSCKIDYA